VKVTGYGKAPGGDRSDVDVRAELVKSMLSDEDEPVDPRRVQIATLNLV
jgi:hypothetical protein